LWEICLYYSYIMFVKASIPALVDFNWFPKSKQIKINSSVSQIININSQKEYFFKFHWNSLVSSEKCVTKTRVLWPWNDFQVYKYNGITFNALLARSLILILSVKFSSNKDDFYFHWQGSITAPYVWYFFIGICFVLGPTEKMWIVEIPFVSQYHTFAVNFTWHHILYI